MLSLLLIFLFLTQFYGVQGSAIDNANVFTEFIKSVIAINSEHSRHEVGKTTLTVADAAKLLELVDEKVSGKIADSSRVAGQIADLFTAITNLREFNQNGNLEQIKEQFSTLLDKVQFLMLLLSFATRLAFTIGSVTFEDHLNLHGFQTKMVSFVNAYKNLMTAFPEEDNKFRYFQVRMGMNADLIKVSFHITENANGNEMAEKTHRRYNFDLILHYLAEPVKARVTKIIEELKYISSSTVQNPYIYSGERKYTYLLINAWKWMIYGNSSMASQVPGGLEWGFKVENPLILFALKNYAANLVKLMLHKKKTLPEAEKYFGIYGNVEHELNGILVELNDFLEENRESAFNMYFGIVNDIEMLMHFEDVLQIDWRIEKEFSLLADYLENLFHSLLTMIGKCKFENDVFVDCAFDTGTIKQEIKENEISIRTLVLKNNNALLLPVSFENFVEISKRIEAIQNEINALNEENNAETHHFLDKIPKLLYKTHSNVRKMNKKLRKLKALLVQWEEKKQNLETTIHSIIVELHENKEKMVQEFAY